MDDVHRLTHPPACAMAMMKVAVRDEGVGISEKQKKLLFTAYAQVGGDFSGIYDDAAC